MVYFSVRGGQKIVSRLLSLSSLGTENSTWSSAWYPSQQFAEDTDRNRNRKHIDFRPHGQKIASACSIFPSVAEKK